MWRNNSFGLHVHVGIRGADRAIRVRDALRPYLPDLLALSASSPFHEGVNTGLHSARTQIFTRMFPRCGVPDAYGELGRVRALRALPLRDALDHEHTQLWWSVRPHLAFPTVEIRICDAQPDLGEARSLAALGYALTARIARALDDGEPLSTPPARLIEENTWRAIRYGLSGELIDLGRGGSIPARAAIERLIEWVQPVAEEIGAAPFLAVPQRTPRSARSRASRRVRASARSSPSRSARRSPCGDERDLGAPGRFGMLNDTLVFWRASGLDPGVGDERAVLRDTGVFLETNRMLVKRARREVVVDGGDGRPWAVRSKAGDVVLIGFEIFD